MTQPPNITPGVPVAPATREKNWFERHWPWLIPVGCLGILTVMVVGVVFVLSLVLGIFKTTDVYKEALAKAGADRRVVAALGSPIKAGFFVMGNINVNGSSGYADFTIPISGPQGKGTIHLSAMKSEGAWTFRRLVVDIKRTGEPIDLLNPDVI